MRKFLVIFLVFFIIGSLTISAYAFDFSKGPIE